MVADNELVQGSRRCSRCREIFPSDPALLFPSEDAWWLCGACDEALLGAGRLRGWSTSKSKPGRDTVAE